MMRKSEKKERKRKKERRERERERNALQQPTATRQTGDYFVSFLALAFNKFSPSRFYYFLFTFHVLFLAQANFFFLLEKKENWRKKKEK